jgi:hypothetical protein
MDTYTVELDPTGGFQVVTWHQSGKRENVVAGYRTYEKAQEQADAMTQLAMKTVIASDGA